MLTRLFALFLAVAVVATIDVTGATYSAPLTATNNGSDRTNFAQPYPLSGASLYASHYINAGMLNGVVLNGTSLVPSMPPSDTIRMLGCVADDGGVQTDQTAACNNAALNDMTLLPAAPAANDAYYFIFDDPGRILTLLIDTPGTGNTLTLAWEYYNGTAYTALTNVVDTSDDFTIGGRNTVSWDMPLDWATAVVSGITGYPVRARYTAGAGTFIQPLATQAWWETGQLWAFIDSLATHRQKQFTLYTGGPDMVTHHEIFPGALGVVTTDSATMEPGAAYLIEIGGFYDTANGAGKDILLKTGALQIAVTNTSELTATVTGLGALVQTGVTSADRVIRLLDDGTDNIFDVSGVGTQRQASGAVPDTANAWNWGTGGSTVYFDYIRESLAPTMLATATAAAWNNGTLTQVAVSGTTLVLDTCGAVYCTSGNWVSPALSTAGITDVDFTTISWQQTTPVGTTVAVYTSLDGGITYQPVTNGGEIASIMPGQDLTGAHNDPALNDQPLIADIWIRVVLTTQDTAQTPVVPSIIMVVGRQSTTTMWYSLNQLPGITITDQSQQANTGTMSFPVGGQFMSVVTGVYKPIAGSSATTQQGLGNPLGQGAEPDLFSVATPVSTFPMQGVLQGFATATGYPVQSFWVVIITILSIMVAVGVYIKTNGSLFFTILAVGIGLIGAAYASGGVTGGGGLIPLMIVFIFFFLAFGVFFLVREFKK